MADVLRVLNRITRGFGFFLLISCIVTFVISGKYFNLTRAFKKSAVETQGEVTRRSRQTLITFSDNSGSERTLVAENRKQYKPGSKVTVLYDPANVKRAEVKSFTTLWMVPVAAAIVASFELMAGLFLIFGVPHIFRSADNLESKATVE
jgi:hypothetical protein